MAAREVIDLSSDDDTPAAAAGPSGAIVLSDDDDAAEPAPNLAAAPRPAAAPTPVTNIAPPAPRRQLVGTAEAKSEYFLTPADLNGLLCQTFGGGIGCGAPRKFYFAGDLQACALTKYGAAGLKSKQEAKQKRESKKRQREADADAALAAMTQRPHPGAAAPPQAAAAGFGAAAAAAASPQIVAPLRKSLLKMAKKALGFTDGGGPKNWRIEAPAIQPAIFAALAGRPADVTLRTFVKSGAYHSLDVDACTLFGCREGDLLRVFKREGVGIQIDDGLVLKFKPSDGTLSVHGGGDIVCDERTGLPAHCCRW